MDAEIAKGKVWDAIVVGAGPAGIRVWESLGRARLSTLLVEAGPVSRRVANVDAQRWRYLARGNGDWVRAHGVGGRSHLWGGWATPFAASVFEEAWPYPRAELLRDYQRAAEWFAVRSSRAHVRYAAIRDKLGFVVRGCAALHEGSSGWLCARALADRAALTGAAALRLVVRKHRAEALACVDDEGRSLTLRARRFVLAASPLESARILLESELSPRELGETLTDHTLVSYLLINPQPTRADRELRHTHGVCVDPLATRRAREARAHHGRFLLEVLGPKPVSSLPESLLTALRLSDRPGAVLTSIGALGEQLPGPHRRLALAPRAKDTFGRRLPVVHAQVSDDEQRMIEAMTAACERVAEVLAQPGAELVVLRDPLVLPPIFHPASTCLMGLSDAHPCTPEGRLRRWDNVWLADASVFPSSGDAHPTLTVIAHAQRAARAAAFCS
ncbi:MAG TPA: GMC oxidoreductase [Polyangiaceae bacterium]|nr:GMC oxidoreductase [Polyangiaceae bacterium]